MRGSRHVSTPCWNRGFLDEVRALRALPALQAHPAPLETAEAIRAVGYRHGMDYLDGHGSAAQFRERAIFATRQLAQRQLTWLRASSMRAGSIPRPTAAVLDQAAAMFQDR